MIAAYHIVDVAQSKRKASVAIILGGSVFVIGFLTAAIARDDSGQHVFFGAPPSTSSSGNEGRYSASAPNFLGTQAPELTVRPLTIRSRDFGERFHRGRNSERHVRPIATRRMDAVPRRVEAAPRYSAGDMRMRRAVVAAPAVPLPPVKDAAAGGGPQRVSIFADKTLRRGDFVMLDQGLRVFSGARSFPYSVADFASMDARFAIKSQFRKILVEIAKNYDRHA